MVLSFEIGCPVYFFKKSENSRFFSLKIGMSTQFNIRDKLLEDVNGSNVTNICWSLFWLSLNVLMHICRCMLDLKKLMYWKTLIYQYYPFTAQTE